MGEPSGPFAIKLSKSIPRLALGVRSVATRISIGKLSSPRSETVAIWACRSPAWLLPEPARRLAPMEHEGARPGLSSGLTQWPS
jgi:hypothetical protein